MAVRRETGGWGVNHGMQAFVEVRDLTLRFSGVTALEDVGFDVGGGQICGLVGPNGAGKSSLFNCVSGYYRPSAGSIRVAGQDVLGVPAHRKVRLGIARTFQHPALQPERTVLDNVLLGGHSTLPGSVLSAMLALPGGRRRERALAAEARELLALLGLAGVERTPAGDLPYGSQKRVEIARALLSRPRLLLLDEPASGLTHAEVGELGELITRIRADHDLTVIVVEHHMGLISAVTDHVVALVGGRKVAEGTAQAVQSDPVVVSAYLGVA
ncbi:ABC transporter ATP-binding protein [Planotetraspora thailandica]|uniref:ABC transporter ATP-binding protein n=1 Tax=Planotetraspora thailandica TaxID=487172 RepID=A0A8J3Y0U3_9ACTN|nr:ABC transporter ATP-binding protein [Planotetraspora thailandica]GII58699.1 ABC transporter ATP-binding protein [Planotetraspora thailandica]